MSHYEVSYKGLEPAEARGKAIDNIQGYLGIPEYHRVSDLLILAREQGEVKTYRDLIMPLMMIGVQGFPVSAWYEELFGERSEEEKAADQAWWDAQQGED